MIIRCIAAALAATVALPLGMASATDLEVTHWWTSGGEAAAVKELAKAFDATGNKWIDGAIAGSGGTARPIMISRITGGDPMGATQFNHGRQAQELVEAGLMRDLTDVATKGHWKDVIKPASLLDSCTIDGKIYCAPVNIHSWQWLWLSNAAFKKAGVETPKNWNEFVAAAPALQKAGIQPLALGGQPWQTSGLFDTLLISLGGKDLYLKVYQDKDEATISGPEFAAIFKAADDARKMSKGTNVQDWNQATNMVITGKAGGQIMGDWAQGEFQLAGQVAGKDYSCLPGLGLNGYLTAGGDAFYFPLLKDKDKSKAQEVLASTIVDPKTQVAFNLKKGSLPIRGDVDLGTANDCMKKGLEILAKGNVLASTDQLMSADTQKQKEDLFSEFFANPSMTPDAAQKRFADIISDAD
ncbi:MULTISPECIES: ABC transporter substrate-binding protein [Rhizobium/Agrobacterium group]|uniref:ABC transporter substrate-binding protein n=1 Tax=Rhizobium/Agrobacterium group TaxID=227290 RepID=UPI000B3FF535|nr:MULTISPECIES: ABC transporter substrate-binding protein [Rhizobium/Agrobacterium group]MCF1483543.1 carbohydrate ABC transporter substrate-binding protein [Allorhizobium ampelinum]NSZ42889.1 carbohydrate ABC transporter substrate-binding protein [Agrobacterium vitis]NTA26546.1 carbohydrate ABC transporter substrate-binding protein [Allorhizobium ampelinum]OVE95037.1 ABC transporter substrate-binding protein [Allorhizobium ampelinum]BCH66144.1 ABC transporter substrate-binding protein [Agrob